MVHLLFIGVVAAGLLIGGFQPPQVPLLAFSALALDLLARRRAPRPLQAALHVAVLFAAYLIELNLFGHGVHPTFKDVALGLPLAFLAAAAVLEISHASAPKSRPPRPVPATSLVTLVLWATLSAWRWPTTPEQGRAREPSTLTRA